MAIHGTAAAQPRTYHADDEVFELTLDGDAHDPLEMVRQDGYDPKRWQFTGQRVRGRQTRRFKWVAVGYPPNIKTVRAKCVKHGRVPEGQWREAVKQMFQPDGQHPRGIADPSWVGPGGVVSFPFVYSNGGSDFCWTDYIRGKGWRWLVEVRLVPKRSLEI